MPALLVVALVVVPIVELYLVVQVGQVLGVLPTLLVLVALSLLGGYLLRREGSRAWRAFREALAAGWLPAKEVTDGGLVLLALLLGLGQRLGERRAHVVLPSSAEAASSWACSSSTDSGASWCAPR